MADTSGSTCGVKTVIWRLDIAIKSPFTLLPHVTTKSHNDFNSSWKEITYHQSEIRKGDCRYLMEIDSLSVFLHDTSFFNSPASCLCLKCPSVCVRLQTSCRMFSCYVMGFLILCIQGRWKMRVTASQTPQAPPLCTDTWTAIILR